MQMLNVHINNLSKDNFNKHKTLLDPIKQLYDYTILASILVTMTHLFPANFQYTAHAQMRLIA